MAAQFAKGYKLRYVEDDKVEVGIDEAGRGCLFGRLYVGCVAFSDDPEVLFDHGSTLAQIKDSKTLSARKRSILYDYVKECALDWSSEYAEPEEIDKLNILEADLQCMGRVVEKMLVPVQRVLVDGDVCRQWGDAECISIVDGDASYLPIAAAAIVAKVEHDQWIEEIVAKHPDWSEKYGFSTNMGYGTATHMKGLETYGATELHRKSFAPVARALGLSVKEKKGKKSHSQFQFLDD